METSQLEDAFLGGGLRFHVGIAAFTLILLTVLVEVWRNVLRPLVLNLWFPVDWKAAGQWAVITGATDGIGKAYALELASKGLDIVLISRTPQKLEATAKEIESSYRVKTKIIVVDFSDDIKIYSKIREELEGLDIGVLVNNVGTAYKFYEYFTRLPDGDKLLDQLFKINMLSYCLMSRIVLPKMCRKKKGIIINVGSASGIVPMPFLSAYGASKHFGHYLSQALMQEYKNSGVKIQLVTPYYLATNLSRIKRVTFYTPKARTYVRWAMLSLHDFNTYAYPIHWVMMEGFLWAGIFFNFVCQNSLAFQWGRWYMVYFKKRHGFFKDYSLTTSSCAEVDPCKQQ